jgi:hypothetical protein
VQHADLLVDPASIVWRPRAPTGFTPRRRRRSTPEQREEMRAASDRRARADQARQAAAETAARESAAQRAASATRSGAGVTAARSLAATVGSRPIAVATISGAVQAVRQPAPAALAFELRRARQRIAELEAELERHRATARGVVRRVEAVVGRRAA